MDQPSEIIVELTQNIIPLGNTLPIIALVLSGVIVIILIVFIGDLKVSSTITMIGVVLTLGSVGTWALINHYSVKAENENIIVKAIESEYSIKIDEHSGLESAVTGNRMFEVSYRTAQEFDEKILKVSGSEDRDTANTYAFNVYIDKNEAKNKESAYEEDKDYHWVLFDPCETSKCNITTKKAGYN